MAKRVRRLEPPKFPDYSSYKPFLREEFDYACAYCEVWESELGGQKSFGADHYKPQSKSSKLIAEYKNLFYCCRDCNSFKGQYWPNALQRLTRKIVLNPIKYDVSIHINKSSDKWDHITSIGKFSIDKLHLNENRVILRKERTVLENVLTEAIQGMEVALVALLEARAQGDATAIQSGELAIEKFTGTVRMSCRRLNRQSE